ncbi:Endoplasmic reticulum-Golgi intermediate compartment protein 2 [Golovinomyces cichoracearum]|uniref:Endoplasmic reticulum-Golgi intermediate compartment protein n=1 Tax=Golovinomyces cichoracearum TaxID=62708 RepID=A0A420J0M1_9PEZI|nr:Endoplasmic reticulum-Golgi intermediate compartment protein 2 [Golovinomyces cichoracearum]
MLRYPQDLDEDAFGEKKGSGIKAFDAFPKAKPQYLTRTPGGGKWTVAILIISSILIFHEFKDWWHGYETHSFSVEKGIAHDMQINLDMVVAIPCSDIQINVLDAAGDRILAGERLKLDMTNWSQWTGQKGIHILGKDEHGISIPEDVYSDHHGFEEDNVRDIVATAGGRKTKFAKTPKIKGEPSTGDSCRIYGSLDVNKVQGDFHITARGHGYFEFGYHLDHNDFNFSHIISELSFGDYYPSLLNPLDGTMSSSLHKFQKYQYFLSIVPTIYSVDTSYMNRVIYTNQYAATEQSQSVDERSITGIFFKYDIEPILLTVEEKRDSFLKFLVKVVNVFSGLLVAGHWGFTLTEFAISFRKCRRIGTKDGVLNGRTTEKYYESF